MAGIQQLRKLHNRQQRSAERSGSLLLRSFRSLQRTIADRALELFFGQAVVSPAAGAIDLLAANRISQQVQVIYEARKPTIANFIYQRFLSLIGLNNNYFEQAAGQRPPTSVQQQLLQLHGLNPADGSLIPGGYLDQWLGSAPVGLRTAQQIQTMFQADQPSLEDFRRQFRAVFVQQGLLERHFQRWSGDLFAQFDRANATQSAQELGMKHFIYAGTLVRDSRLHCRRRVNRIYTLDEEKKWDSLQWAGKIPGVPASVQQGGYNCLHSRMFISDEMAEIQTNFLGPINSYNSLPSKGS